MRVRVVQSHFFYLYINFASVLGRGDAHGGRCTWGEKEQV